MRLPETIVSLCGLEAVLSLQHVPGPLGQACKRASTRKSCSSFARACFFSVACSKFEIADFFCMCGHEGCTK
jgi:hypothetical protein